jgi:hypothetical protein
MKKYQCDECKKKVYWIANGLNGKKIEKFGQQFALGCNENTPTSEVLTALRTFLCYSCAKKRGWDIEK